MDEHPLWYGQGMSVSNNKAIQEAERNNQYVFYIEWWGNLWVWPGLCVMTAMLVLNASLSMSLTHFSIQTVKLIKGLAKNHDNLLKAYEVGYEFSIAPLRLVWFLRCNYDITVRMKRMLISQFLRMLIAPKFGEILMSLYPGIIAITL